jgi:hypothetical protein
MQAIARLGQLYRQTGWEVQYYSKYSPKDPSTLY